jgi:hypothetical protein
MTDAEKIAAALTPAQRRALLWLPGDGSWRARGKAHKDISRTSMYCMADIRHGDPRLMVATVAALCDGAPPKQVAGRWAADEWRATPLGLAVRAVLKATHD